MQALKVQSEIKAYAECNRDKPGQIITDKLSTQPKEVIVAASPIRLLEQIVRRATKGTTPKYPSTIRDIPVLLPGEFATNVIYDNELPESRILIVCPLMAVSVYSWFMDDTHSTSPSQFQQLFVIDVSLGDSCVSPVYALLPSKHQTIYEAMLTALLGVCLQRGIRPNPERILADYEVAIHNAVRTVFTHNIHIQGCCYHRTQATCGKVQSEGLQSDYNNDDEVRTFCAKLDGLAVLPPNDVKDDMAVLREQAPDQLQCLVEYFGSNYVNGTFRAVMSASGHMRFRRSAPRSPSTLECTQCHH